MTLDNILNAVAKKRPDLERSEARAIATDILYSGEEPEDILASDSVIDKLVSGYKTRQSSMAKSVAANDPTTCPVCKLPLKPVTLADDRQAVYCSKHFVVFPVPPKEKKEETE